jgi:hypothetical protein
MHRSISIFLALSTLLMTASPAATSAQGLNARCQPVLDAMSKMVVTPTHVYTTETAAFRADGKPTSNETIYAGGAIYVKVNGEWIRSTITPQEMLRQEQADRKNGRETCRYLHEESVNGETATVYSTHGETPDAKSEAQLWISKSKGLPLREELDMDIGGKLGKSHRSMRYEYDQVHPPRM